MRVGTQAGIQQKLETCSEWPERFGTEQWAVYRLVMTEASRRGIPFAVGGGLTAMTYAGLWRNTKDIDLYILPSDREPMVQVVFDVGLKDYYEKLAYDRAWIFRSYQADTIVDLMWGMANQRAWVDEDWLRGPEVEADGVPFRLLPPELALWTKLYVLQRDRCDWPDAFNILCGVGSELDWKRLFRLLGSDVPLLAALLSAYAWLTPDGARQLPSWIWTELGLSQPEEESSTALTERRTRLLDSRPWFAQGFSADANSLQFSTEL